MATMTNSQRLEEARRKREEEEKKRSSSSSASYSNSAKIEKLRLERNINFDTFESDLQTMGTTIGGIYNGWQTPETMNTTRSSIEAMQNRINAYQTYQSKFGGNDLSEVASGYQSVLDDWDNLTNVYGYYQNADAFNTAKQKAQFDEQFGGLSYDDVQAKKGEYAEDSEEYKYLSEYMGYTDLRDFDKALEEVEMHLGSGGRGGDESKKEAYALYQKQLQEARNQYALDNAFDLYKHYLDAEDFEWKSRYESTKDDSFGSGLTSQYGMGYEDLTYEYINNVDGIRDEIKRRATAFGADTSNTISVMEKNNYDMMNEEEIAVYNYIYRTEGKEKAEEYLIDIERMLGKRANDEATQRWEEFADSGVVQSALMSALSVPANIMGGFTGTVDALGDAIQGKPYNPYGYYKMPTNFASDTRQYVGENIAEATEGMELFGQNVPSFLYQTGMSTADSAVGALTLGKGFAPIMGMTAYQQRAKELTEAGASEEEAMIGALASGVFEMAFEKLSLDNLFKIKNADSLGKIFTQTLKQAGIEGSEEFATEVANVVFDRIQRGESSDVYQMYEEYLARGFSEEEAERKVKQDINAQIGYAFAGGALSGTGMGAGASIGNYSGLKATGQQIKSNNRVQDMVDLSALTPEESDAYRLYTEYANKGITAENISDAKLGNLYATTQADAYSTLQSKKATVYKKNQAMDTIKGLRTVDTAKESKVTSTGKITSIEGIKKVDGNTVLVTNEGDVSVEDMTLSYNDAEMVSYVASMSEEKANLFITQYDGKSDLEAYANSFNMAYAYGEDGFDADTVLNNKGVLTEAQAFEIYKTAITNKVTAQQKAIDDINAKQGKTVTVAGTFNDSIIDYNSATTDGSKVNWNSLTSRQRDAIIFARGFSEATGVNITFITSKEAKDKDGNITRTGKNGSYNPATNTIEIDVYAGIDAKHVEDSIIPTLSHEMTHWMKAKAPSMYSKMKNHIMDTLVMDGTDTAEVIVNKEMNRIQKNHPDMKVTREYAMDELVARACEDMLSNSDKTRKMMNQLSKKEQSSFVAKVKETIKNLMEWVNELLGKYKSNSNEAKVLRQYKDRLKQLSKMWDKALGEAIHTNNALKLEKKTGEQVLNEAGETQWADRVEEEFNVDYTIEQTDGLIAVHNLSEEKLLKTLKLGAFPMPSIAVTKASIGHKGFGDISLLFTKDTIDPRFFRSNRVYSGDAWTPTYPSIDYKVNEKVEKRASDKYYELSKRIGYDEARPFYPYAINMEETLNRNHGEKGMLEKLYEDTGVMQVFLQDTGRGKVEPIERETRTEISEADRELNEAFIDAFGKETLAEFKTPEDASPMTYRKEFISNHKEDIVKAYRKVLSELYGFTEEGIENTISNMRQLDFMMLVRNAFTYTQNNGVTVTVETDYNATNEAIKNASADGYKEWVDSTFKGAEEKTGIRNNKEYYDSRGNQRSWDVLHYEETLENIIKAMKEQGEKGISVLGSNSNIFGASAKELESIEEIKEAGKRLRTVSQEEFGEMKDAFLNRFKNIADSLRSHDGWQALDGASELLVEAVSKYNTRNGIANYIKREGKGWTNYSERIVDDLIALVNDIRNMPVNYFEAKPMRAVGFDEVACAVIPDNASERVRGELSKLNIPMKEYKAGDEDARVEAVNSVEGIQFSDRDSDGMELTEAQVDFFEDSKIRDNNGSLKVMYHGSGASFTVFDKKKAKSSGYYGSGFYFTESSSHAQQYGSKYKVYLNITNPMQEGTKNITKAQLKKFVQEVADNEDYGIDNYGYGATVDSVTNSIYGKDDFGMIMDINATCIGDMVEAIMLFNEVNGTTYDGIIVPTETVAFYPNQIKNVDNLNPTENEDIRYSDRNEFGLTKYTEKEIENWNNSNILYANSEQDIIDYVENHVKTGENTRLYCGKIAGAVAERIKKDTGYDLKGYNVALTSSFENSHANEADEALLGQIAMTPSEVAKFPYVISDYDTVTYGGVSKEKNPVLKFEKVINGRKIAVTYILTKRRMLKLQTIYGWAEKKNHLTATDASMTDANARTSKTNSDIDSDYIISESEGIATYSEQFSERDIDSWLDALSIEDLMDSLDFYDSNIGNDTNKVTRAKRRVDEVNKRLKAIGLSFNGTKSLAWTDERIKKYLGGGYYGSSNPNYAQAYIAYVTPQQFLNLTVGGKNTTLDMIEKESEAYGEVDIEKLGDSNPLSLYIEEGRVWTKVNGHEGRHRMYLLGKAGFEKVPVLLFDYSTKYNKTAKNEMKLIAQRFNDTDLISKSRNVVLNDVIPFSQGNRDLIIEKFGSGKEADIHYSERDNVSVYDLMGQNKTLQKQNAKLEEDVARLKERLKLEKQVTKGNAFNANQLRSVAKFLRNSVSSTYEENALVEELKEVYSYIVESPQLDWADLMAKCYEVARNVLDESKGYKITNDYYKDVLEDIRRARITLNEEQVQEAKSAYGARYRDAFMGRVMLVNNGTSLDQKWQEWAYMYPEIFDENVTGGDQITALSDIYDALREGAETYRQYNDVESIRAFAVEIYNQYWNVSTIRTTADKYDKQIKRLNFEHRTAMNELRSDYKKRVEDQKKADAIHYGKMISDIRRRREAEVKQAKESGKQRLADYKDRVAKNAKIDKITKNALTLNQWLTKNSKDAHIPEVMKAPVAYLLSAIDFSSKQLLGMRGGIYANTPTKKDVSLSKALEQVHDMVQKINSAQIGEDEITEIYGTFADFPMGFADDIRDLSSKVNDIMRTVGDNAYVLNEMSLEQLEELDKILTIMKATVTKMNKFLAIRHAEGVAHMSQQSINYLDSLGKAKERGKAGSKIEKMLDWGNALPYYTFKRFGEGGQKVYEALQDGWDKFAFHISDIIKYAESTYTDKEVKEWEAVVKEFSILEPATDKEKASPNYTPKYQKIQMTVPQIMSLYCLQKREQAKGHLMGGGMRIADFEVGKVQTKTVSQTEGVVLSESEIDTIINSLTDRQKAVADALQNFMNTTCTDWGNEVSMLRFGFKAFGEENYFPIQSDKNNLAVNDETEQNNSLFRLLNMSFTKGTIKQANNRIVISDIFDVFAQHASDMAKYNALAMPVIDSFKWYNYKEKIKKGETQFTTKSLKESLESAFGKQAQNYIVTFLKDINGEQSAGRDVVGKGFATNAKLASVGFNMRVVALQPTSYVRASALIAPKYLTRAFAHKPKMQMAQKYCGIALWKSLGFYDINVQNSVTDLIKHNQTARDKVVEASMKGAEMADKVTWGYLWNACELEVRDKRKDLKVGSDEFYSAVANRLREVIYATQVVDSTMTRSHMMRSKDGWDKMATAFMSEPTLAYNMLQDCYMDWKLTERQTGSKQKAFSKSGKKMARVFTAYAVTNMLSALVESGFDIFRDDEDEVTPEEFIELYLKNFASNMSILNKIPYAKEVTSLMQGYSSSRTDTQWMQYLTYTATGVGKLLEGEGNAYTTAKNAMRAFSYATGLPLYNVWRDSTALLDETEVLTAEELEEMFNETIAEIFPSLKAE